MGRGDKKRRKCGIQKGSRLTRPARITCDESGEQDELVNNADRSWKRPDRDIYDLSLKPGSDLRPTRLRPKPGGRTGHTLHPPVSNPSTITGNRIVSFTKLEELINSFLVTHSLHSPNCIPHIAFVANCEKRWGLVVEETVQCTKCSVVSESTKLYDVVTNTGQKGRSAAKVNIQLQVAMTKLPIGNAAVRLLLGSIDVPVPSERSLQHLANRVAKECVDVNEDQMQVNRTKLKQCLKMRADDDGHGQDSLKFSAQTDTTYNNNAKGRAFSQPGTQASAPLIETETNRKMVVAFSTVNKHCVKCSIAERAGDTGSNHSGCSRTYKKHTPIGNAEPTLAEQNATVVYGDGLAISTLCTDSDASILKSVQKVAASHKGEQVKKMACTVHISRGLKRRFYQLPLTHPLFESVPPDHRKHFRERLARATQARCHGELKGAMARWGSNKEQYVKSVSAAAKNIPRCFSGDHTACRSSSYVCHYSGRGDKLIKYLPNNKCIPFTPMARLHLLDIIEYQLGVQACVNQCYGVNTNKSEATHIRCLKSVPKSKLFMRNFAGRCHSAIHTSSVGIATSIQLISERLGAKLTNVLSLQSMQARDDYWQKRAKTIKYIMRRRQLSRQKMKSSVQQSAYRSGHLQDIHSQDHLYS